MFLLDLADTAILVAVLAVTMAILSVSAYRVTHW